MAEALSTAPTASVTRSAWLKTAQDPYVDPSTHVALLSDRRAEWGGRYYIRLMGKVVQITPARSRTVVQITQPGSPRRDTLIVEAEHRAVCEYMQRPGLSAREWRMLWLRKQSLELELRLGVLTPRAKRVSANAERIQDAALSSRVKAS